MSEWPFRSAEDRAETERAYKENLARRRSLIQESRKPSGTSPAKRELTAVLLILSGFAALALGALYLLVRFIKWAWGG